MIEVEEHIGELLVYFVQEKALIEQRNQYYENLVSRNPSQLNWRGRCEIFSFA